MSYTVIYVYQRQIVNDGNFKAQNSYSGRPDIDVCLYDGEGYMVAEKPYQDYLSKVPSKKELKEIHDILGLLALQLVPVPVMAVLFPTLWLIFKTKGLRGALDIYDINCQYCRKFWERVRAHPQELGLPEHIDEATLIFAVGSFHLSAHVAECYSEFSLHFIEGIGHIDGEILETLWAAFNNISPMCRPMTASQRREIYDDFMRDSNWKKTINIGMLYSALLTLNKKFDRAEEGLADTTEGFERVNQGLSDALVKKWRKAEKLAMEKRGKYLKCYDVRHVKAATLAEIQMEYLNGKKGKDVADGSVAWLAEAIAIEAAQDKFSTDTRRLLGTHATIPTKTAFAHRQSRLLARVRKFQREALTILGVEDEKSLALRLGGENLAQINLDLDDGGWGELIDMELDPESPGSPELISPEEEDLEERGPDEVRPDRSILLVPSAISSLVIARLGLDHLAEVELEMRKGQANDSLEGLMLALCTQGLLLRTTVRNADGTKTKTRAFNEVTKVRREVETHVRSYRRARKAILALSRDPELAKQYQPIGQNDLKTADITDERRLGQSRDTLAWFWQIGAEKAEKHEWTEEFYRVSWLRAKARKDRWSEEKIMVSHEMLFVILFHEREAKVWKRRARKSSGSGAKVFAHKRMLVSERRAEDARRGFAGKVCDTDWEEG
ncbi:hypothetical protein HWV62_28190 [Athelia sp. TMB]|nr:hypothetical protein HWV62_28190 [Athelia sp. TMB]